MLFATHILLGISLFILTRGLFTGGNEIVFFILVLLGSILPDLDERNSKINQWSGFIGKIIVFFFKHRGLLHSLLFHVGLFVLVSYTFNTYYAAALFIGYIAHLIGDGITPMGVQVLYPFSKFKLRGPFRVGGFVEKIIMVSLSVFILFRFL